MKFVFFFLFLIKTLFSARPRSVFFKPVGIFEYRIVVGTIHRHFCAVRRQNDISVHRYEILLRRFRIQTRHVNLFGVFAYSVRKSLRREHVFRRRIRIFRFIVSTATANAHDFRLNNFQ